MDWTHPLLPRCTRFARRAVATLVVLFTAGSTHAEVPTYPAFELQARASPTGVAFNLPTGASISSATVALDHAGTVAIKALVPPDGDPGIFRGRNGTGSIVYTAPSGAFASDVTMGAGAHIVFELSFITPDGLYFYDHGDGSSGLLTDLPFGADDWGSPCANLAGEVGYRAGFSGDHAFVSYDGVSATAVHAAEVGLDSTSPYSFLFTPAFDDLRRIAGKVRLGGAGQISENRPDEIRLFESNGSSTLMAEDNDANAGSPFAGFDNSVAVNAAGQVAFVASLVAGGRGVFRSHGATTVTIATDADPNLTEIVFFGPALNDSGVVAFRGRDADGLEAIFVGDGITLRRLIGEHDLVATDLGTARLDQHDNSPIFGGGVAINARGDVAFAAGLTPPDNNQIEWGSGVFRAVAALFADGFESGDTSAWTTTEP